ncbi:MAG: hypothetical protein ACOVNL_11840 [Prochlorococcaceae cyanobacterium]
MGRGRAEGAAQGGRFVVMLDHRPFACCLSRMEAYSLAYRESGQLCSRGACVLSL